MGSSKVWYVTGASQGLGLILVKKLLENGYRVAASSQAGLNHRNPFRLVNLEDLVIDYTKNLLRTHRGRFGCSRVALSQKTTSRIIN
jgi:NAD(P)-dependent dehydrogenase (short-subunit alcohol dehydrogenase family)